MATLWESCIHHSRAIENDPLGNHLHPLPGTAPSSCSFKALPTPPCDSGKGVSFPGFPVSPASAHLSKHLQNSSHRPSPLPSQLYFLSLQGTKLTCQLRFLGLDWEEERVGSGAETKSRLLGRGRSPPKKDK